MCVGTFVDIKVKCERAGCSAPGWVYCMNCGHVLCREHDCTCGEE